VWLLAPQRFGWLADACMGPVIVMPVMASIHAIVLLVGRQPCVIDLDMYGAAVVLVFGIMIGGLAVTQFDSAILRWCAPLELAGVVSVCLIMFLLEPRPCVDPDGEHIIISPQDLSQCVMDCSVFSRSFIRRAAGDSLQKVFWPDISEVGWWLAIPFTCGASMHLFLLLLIVKPCHRRARILSIILDSIMWLILTSVIVVSEWYLWSDLFRVGSEPVTSVGQWSQLVIAILSSVVVHVASRRRH